MPPAELHERAARLQSQWGSLRGDAEAAERRLRGLHAAAQRFWGGAAELRRTLADTQRLLLRCDGAGGEPEGIGARLQAVQVCRECDGMHAGRGGAAGGCVHAMRGEL